MELSRYKACICEGAAESAIIDILVDNNLLIFSRSETLTGWTVVHDSTDEGSFLYLL